MRRYVCAFAALVLSVALWTAAVPALAADNGADPLTLRELQAWLEDLRTLASEGELYSDPHDPLYQSEDGYAFAYDFGTLYYDSPDLTPESRLLAAVVYDAEAAGPRGTNTLMTLDELLASFYTENETLAGTRTQALIYWGQNLPESSRWGMANRDGQWVDTVQYAVHERLEDGTYTDTGLLFTLQQNTVVAIRAYGLCQTMTEAEVRAEESELQALAEASDYAMVPTSADGSALTPFAADDLRFLGIDFLTCTPEEAEAALGSPDADDIQSGMRVMSWTDCELVFLPDARGDWQLTMATVTGAVAEGPRAVRVGDTVAMVTRRFRFDTAVPEGSTLRLYGTEGEGSWGVAEYGDDASAVLRYGVTLEDGSQAVLMLSFEMLELQEITVYRTH